ncbi:MAG: thioredoxin domain-containing protein [Vicinamibacteria bacterium]
MSENSSHPANRLIHSTSPYLLQHAHNPVDWYPWGEEALARSRDEDRPILLSIGYSSCHWCHVMERESFENDTIAKLMNDGFICIKVDREERPDIDDIYMAATLAMNHGQGGWPMTVFLTPKQEPFFAGTYFPPEDRYGRPGFGTLLQRIGEIWREDRVGLNDQAEKMAGFLRANAEAQLTADPSAESWMAFQEQCASEFDSRFGGFGTAPKFPPHQALLVLLRQGRDDSESRARFMATTTLDAMAGGGIYDHIGGGFARYSTDREWLVPHFEKMLYDNAQLVRAYTEGFQITKDPAYERVTREVLDYVLKEMTSAEGAFYSATDADSEGVEGKFFVWTKDEVDALLGEADSKVFCDFYDITEGGNWEGHAIPNTRFTREEVAKRHDLTKAALDALLERGRRVLYETRARRIPPALDDKTLTSWNGLMIGAMAEAGRVLGERRYVAAAERAATFLWDTHRREGRLLRSSRGGVAQGEGFLEDYAFLANALVDLYEAGARHEAGATSGLIWLERARDLVESMLDLFPAVEGGFYMTSRFNESLLLRHREGHDGATPSANGQAALALARLGVHWDRGSFRDAAKKAMSAYGVAIEKQPRAFPTSLLVLEFLRHGPIELALIGDPTDARTEALERVIASTFLSQRVIARGDGVSRSSHPLLRGKARIKGAPAVYVCRNYACDLPITDPNELKAKLA